MALKLDRNLFREILADKLADEGTGFTKKDIIIFGRKHSSFHFYIRGYEHIVYAVTVREEIEDAIFGKYVMTIESSYSLSDTIIEWGNDVNRLLREITLQLGYQIGNTY